MIAGGLTQLRPADDGIKALANHHKADVEKALNRKFEEKFEAVNFSSQVVSGANYYINVDVGGDEIVQITIYKHWSGESSLSKAVGGKKFGDPFN